MRRRIVASRGRYNENGAITQHCELLKGKCTNTITTVTKDNLVLVRKSTKNNTRIQKEIR